jgi:WD40 repeat protein
LIFIIQTVVIGGGTWSSYLYVYDKELNLIKSFSSGRSYGINRIKLLPNEYVATSSTDRTIKIWETPSWKCIFKFIGSNSWSSYSGSGIEYLYNNVTATSGTYGTINIWDFITGEIKLTIRLSVSTIICLQKLPNNSLAGGLQSSQIYIWNYFTGVQVNNGLLNLHSNQVNDLLLLDNQTLASSSLDNSVIIWNIETRKYVFKLYHDSDVYGLEMVSTELNWFASCSSNSKIKIWSNANGSLIRTLMGHKSGLKWSLGMFNERVLLSGSLDRTIKFWNIDTGEQLLNIKASSKIGSLTILDNFTAIEVPITTTTTTKKTTALTSTTVSTKRYLIWHEYRIILKINPK